MTTFCFDVCQGMDCTPTDSAATDCYASAATLAREHGLPLPALKKRLERWRRRHALGDAYIEVENPLSPRAHGPRYLYHRSAVAGLCASLQRDVPSLKRIA
jgi:hypothetical protein